MNARPVLMHASSVLKVLAGRKTQTRRIVKPQPPASAKSAGVISSGTSSNGLWWWLDSRDLDGGTVGEEFRCPYGVPGDLLWVRETWRAPANNDPWAPHRLAHNVPVWYSADNGKRFITNAGTPGKTRTSIHMPRWASRLTLRLTDVRAERLNEISDRDCVAEGVGLDAFKLPGDTALVCYRRIWEEIHGEFSWGDNPWVWALTFEVLRENVDHVLRRVPA